MKTTTSKLDVTISRQQLEAITKEVKETLAFEFYKQNSKHFSTVDLWDIQRQRKRSNPRRNYI